MRQQRGDKGGGEGEMEAPKGGTGTGAGGKWGKRGENEAAERETEANMGKLREERGKHG